MGLFDFLDRTAGDSKLSKDLSSFTKYSYGNADYGKTLTDEGLGGLRSLDSTYQNRLADPLGSVGRGIFARAQGALTDQAQRNLSSGRARIFQLATQSGGALTPEAQAQLESENARSTDESLFTSRNALANQEAGMTLAETGKLFDRMEGIRKTIVGVGQDERTRALSSIIASLAGRTDRMKAIWGDVVGGIR